MLGNNGALRGSPFSLALPLWRHGSFIGTTSKPPIFRLEMCEVPHRVAWLTAATIGIALDKRGGLNHEAVDNAPKQDRPSTGRIAGHPMAVPRRWWARGAQGPVSSVPTPS